MNSTVSLVIVIAGLALTIMLHELGHLLVAKACGMKVTQYFVGFGPRIWSTVIGETEYGIRAIPAGGFVKIPGMSNLEEVDGTDEARTYRQSSFPRKVAVVSAGSAVHFLLAFVMLWALFSFVGMPTGQRVTVSGFSALPGGADPARSAGVERGDVIETAGGRRITSTDQLASLIGSRPGQPVDLTLLRHGHSVAVTVVPRGHPGSARIGISIEPIGAFATVNPAVAVPRSFGWIGTYVSTASTSLGTEFSDAWQVLTNASVPANSQINQNRPMSIIGATRIAAQAAQAGVGEVLLIFVMLNIFIGIFNMFPIPVLDGGHVALAVYERIRTGLQRYPYRADYAKLLPLAYATVAVLVLLGGSLVYLDIVKPIPSPFH